jgi:AcrR family transcriptional regulator
MDVTVQYCTDVSRAQLSPQDWTSAALRALADGGVTAVRVDVLARGLGVSRGSFYWHFADRDALLRAALEQWEQTVTAQVIERMEDVGHPLARFEKLVRAAFGPEAIPGLQPAILAHAGHPIVEPVLRRVTARRIDFIAEVYRDLGLASADARRRAVVAYATYLGWLDLRRGPADIVPEVAAGPAGAATVDEVLRMLLAAGNPGSPPP